MPINYNNSAAQHKIETLKQGFVSPPVSTPPCVYWYWINDHISEEGITKDLKAMKDAGIGTALIGNIGLDNTPAGKVRVLSKEPNIPAS